MLSIRSLVLLLVTSLSLVEATRYCQCENPTFNRKFSGINQACTQLSDDWCATNCNFLSNLNCNYCQWIPSGPEPIQDYAQLKAWCGSQQGVDPTTGQSYQGTDLFCYSNINKINCGNCGGCAYNANSFFKRDEEALMVSMPEHHLSKRVPQLDPDQSGNNVDVNAIVTVQFQEFGITLLQKQCKGLYVAAATYVAKAYSGIHSCTPSGIGSSVVGLQCSGVENLATALVDNFAALCQSQGGHVFQGPIEALDTPKGNGIPGLRKRSEDVRVHFVG